MKSWVERALETVNCFAFLKCKLTLYYCGQKKWDINVIVLTFNVK
jgi:hypothetical protein